MEDTIKKGAAGIRGNDGGGFIWFLGAIGAAVYYIQNAESLAQGVLGLLKALVWPAMIVYYTLRSFGV